MKPEKLLAEVRRMSTQRKLTDHERRQASEARVYIVNMCEWKDLADGHQYWHGVASRLLAMVEHATTDGNPWIEPNPPIPDGYRLAVAADEKRPDRMYWEPNGSLWEDAEWDAYAQGTVFIVPIDRIPTDEDAKSRPEVMVRDHSGQLWTRRTLVAVCKHASWPFFTLRDGQLGSYQQCRFPYPNESP